MTIKSLAELAVYVYRNFGIQTDCVKHATLLAAFLVFFKQNIHLYICKRNIKCLLTATSI